MRKGLILILFIALSFSIALAGVNTSYDILDNLHGNINFNVPRSDITSGNTTYIPMVVNLDGTAKTSDGGKKGVKVIREIGSVSNTTLEGKDLYLALPTWARPMLKELYQEAIDLDVTN